MTTRRTVLAAGLGAAASGVALADVQTMPKTFVLVHGAWHGGWCWRRVADLLERQGHKVFTPTLTGLGERSHLMSRDINLDTHITDRCCAKRAPTRAEGLVGGELIGVGRVDWLRHPLPPNRTCGFPDIRLSSRWFYLPED
jgi:hypothetical protein